MKGNVSSYVCVHARTHGVHVCECLCRCVYGCVCVQVSVQVCACVCVGTSGGSRGGARGAGAPPLAREKNFFYIASCRYVATPGLAPWPPQLAISCFA